MPVRTVECPCTYQDLNGCDLPECSSNTDLNALCEADSVLPDGHTNYEVDNCPDGYDVFKRIKGKTVLVFRYNGFIIFGILLIHI